MNLRHLLATAAVSAALAGLGGCNRDEGDRTATNAPPASQPAPNADSTAPAPTPGATTAEPGGTAAPPAASSGGSTATEPGGAPSQGSAAAAVDDATVTAKVKAALMAEQEVDGTRIDVDTTNGRVVLKGKVPSQKMVDRAAQVARSVEGVRDIDNQLVASGAS